MADEIKFRRGNAAQLPAASSRDVDTLYFVKDQGGLFLGADQIAVAIGSSNDATSAITYYGLKKYTDTNFVTAVAEGNANGKIAITKNGTTTQISVHGLGSAAYTDSTAYATKAQGDKADSAIQGVDSSDSDAISFTTDSSKIAYAEIHLDGTGIIPLEVVPGSGITASLNSSFVNGTPSTANQLLTKSGADGLYATKAQGTLAENAVRSVSSGDTATLTVTTTNHAVTVTPVTGAITSTGANTSLVTGAQVKTYVDSQVAGFGNALRYVGESSTVPTAGGATVADLPSGFTWKIGDVVTCSVSGYTGKEYLLYKGTGTNINVAANWRELGEEGLYALKTTKIQANNGLTISAGGTLGSDTTIAIDSATKTKIDNATQGVSAADESVSVTAVSGNKYQVAVQYYNTGHSIQFGVDNANGGLYADISSSYIHGTLSTSDDGKLVTRGHADGRYGRLASANTWSGANTFTGNISATGASVDLDLSTSISISANGSNVINGDGGDVTVGDPTTGLTLTGGTITSGLITCSATPSTGNHLTNKTYVDSAISSAALRWLAFA